MVSNKYAIIGIGGVIEKYPAMADGMNEKGLAYAVLNFVGFAYYEEKRFLEKLILYHMTFYFGYYLRMKQ